MQKNIELRCFLFESFFYSQSFINIIQKRVSLAYIDNIRSNEITFYSNKKITKNTTQARKHKCQQHHSAANAFATLKLI